jgi:heptosyltransferase I
MGRQPATRQGPRILIVRLSAIGDVIHTLPMLCALRAGFPQAMLSWVVDSRAAGLLEGHEALDELIVVPRGFLKSPAQLWRLTRRLRSLELDVAIDGQGLSKSALVAWLSGARRRIGFGRPWGREMSSWLNRELIYPTATHVIERNLQLLLPLGIQRTDVRFNVPENDGDRGAAAALVRQAGIEGRLGIINVGAGWPSKLWPVERYAAVARYLGEAWRLPTLVVWSGENELAMADEIVAGAAGHARLAPPTTLRELASLARRAQLFIGSDTGPLHLAVAVGTPCVGLYGPWPATTNGPYGPQHVAIQKMTLEGSTRDRRHASAQYMDAIDIESVCDACDQILRREAWCAA